MKRSISRLLVIMLALALTLGLLPTTALAGGDFSTVSSVSVFVTYPVAGAHPVLSGYAEYDEDPYVVDEVHYFELDSEGNPVGKFLDESDSFVAGRQYACQILVRTKPDYRFFPEVYDVYGWVNNRYAEVSVLSSDTAALTVFFSCAEGTYTVTFDANGSEQAPPAALQVPAGATVWDALRNYEAVSMDNQPWEQFFDWSLDPFATYYGDFYPFDEPIYQDLTLYAMWIPCERTVELWVELPANCMTDGVEEAAITVPEVADYSADTSNLYVGLVDGYLHGDLITMDPLQKGVTYYGGAWVHLPIAGQMPEIVLHGAELVSVHNYDDTSLAIVYSVTPQTGAALSRAGVAINTPKAGQNAIAHHPEIISLTPGVQAGVQGWFESPELGAEVYEGALVGGRTYYALVYVGDDTGSYTVSANTLSLELQGKNVELVRMVDLSDTMPNYAGAVVAVTIPRAYDFVANVKYGGGRIRSDREGKQWVNTMDISGTEEGPVTLFAKAEPGYQFKMWYDADSGEILSRDPEYTFNLEHDVDIVASFVKKPFAEVGAWDYYYEPVMWAVEHDPVITAGMGDGSFGVGSPCTRAQIMTFLWKANDAPNPVTTVSPFSDVQPDDYYFKAVLWAVENHITAGVGEGRFGAYDPCTREQAMAFLWKSKGSPEPESLADPFSDVQPDHYFYKAVLWAANQTPPITAGIGDGSFGVGKTCTREQIITFLYKVYGPKG